MEPDEMLAALDGAEPGQENWDTEPDAQVDPAEGEPDWNAVMGIESDEVAPTVVPDTVAVAPATSAGANASASVEGAPEPPVYRPQGITDEQRRQFEDQLATGDVFSAIDRIVEQRLNEHRQADVVSDYHVSQIPPQFTRVHGNTMRQVMNSLPLQQRGSREAAYTAAVMAVAQEAVKTGDLAGAMRRAADLMTGEAARPVQAPQQQKPSAPAARVPASGNSGGAVVTRRANPAVTGRESEIKRVATMYGVSEASARRMLEDQL